ncbi:hypothetical protein BC567DRAFT_274495 [Phyllosticta citribraziliensis]
MAGGDNVRRAFNLIEAIAPSAQDGDNKTYNQQENCLGDRTVSDPKANKQARNDCETAVEGTPWQGEAGVAVDERSDGKEDCSQYGRVETAKSHDDDGDNNAGKRATADLTAGGGHERLALLNSDIAMTVMSLLQWVAVIATWSCFLPAASTCWYGSSVHLQAAARENSDHFRYLVRRAHRGRMETQVLVSPAGPRS